MKALSPVPKLPDYQKPFSVGRQYNVLTDTFQWRLTKQTPKGVRGVDVFVKTEDSRFVAAQALWMARSDLRLYIATETT